MNFLQDLTLRIDDPQYVKRVLKVVSTGWVHKGMLCVLQHNVKAMESKPSRLVVDYLLKLFVDGNVSYPSVQDAISMLNNGGKDILEIDGIKKTLDEWKQNKQETFILIKSLKKWE